LGLERYITKVQLSIQQHISFDKNTPSSSFMQPRFSSYFSTLSNNRRPNNLQTLQNGRRPHLLFQGR